MTQQVNLLTPNLVAPKTILSLMHIGIVYGVTLLISIAWFVYLNSQLSGLSAQHAAMEETLLSLEDAALAQTESGDQQKPEQTLRTQINRLKATKQVHAQILNQLRDRQPQDLTLSHYMKGLARQTVEGVWLTGFSIREKGKAITLRGRSLASEMLPVYIKKLGREPLFRGVGFAGLHVSLPSAVDLPVMKEGEATALALNYIEFELQSPEFEKADQADAVNRLVAEVMP